MEMWCNHEMYNKLTKMDLLHLSRVLKDQNTVHRVARNLLTILINSVESVGRGVDEDQLS